MRRLPAATVALVGAVTVVGTSVRATSTDDQAAADAAIAAFTERATAAGWVSGGPFEPEEEPTEDELFSACEREFASIDAIFTGQFDGETAQAYSDQFVYAPADGEPATTDVLDVSTDDEELLAAFVVSVDEDHVDDLDTLVDLIGSPELVECAEQSLEESTSGTATSELELPEEMFQVSVDNEADLGVGDASARLHISIDANLFGEAFVVETTLLFARVDRTLVGVLSGQTGEFEPVSEIDPLAELTALVEDVSD